MIFNREGSASRGGKSTTLLVGSEFIPEFPNKKMSCVCLNNNNSPQREQSNPTNVGLIRKLELALHDRSVAR